MSVFKIISLAQRRFAFELALLKSWNLNLVYLTKLHLTVKKISKEVIYINLISLRSREYQQNITVVKKFNDNTYKLTRHKSLRVKGVENDDRILSARCSVNEFKTDDSISRARSKIFEYSLCNEFEYFMTLTLDPKKYDRSNLDLFIKDLGQFIRNYRRKYNADIQYILIPEHHADNESWHMHGLIKGIPAEHFQKNKNGYLDWFSYSKKFGYCSIGKIKNQEACAKYITKYIAKNLGKNIDLNKKLYYCSKGLKEAQIIKKGTMSANISPDFENDYVSITWIAKKNIDLILEKII